MWYHFSYLFRICVVDKTNSYIKITLYTHYKKYYEIFRKSHSRNKSWIRIFMIIELISLSIILKLNIWIVTRLESLHNNIFDFKNYKYHTLRNLFSWVTVVNNINKYFYITARTIINKNHLSKHYLTLANVLFSGKRQLSALIISQSTTPWRMELYQKNVLLCKATCWYRRNELHKNTEINNAWC